MAAAKERCKPGCDCSGWAPIPLKPNMCSLCGHSMVFHDDDDVAAVSVHQGHNTLEQRKKEKEAELAPLKRKSVVQLYAPLFEGKKEEAPTKIEAPRRPRAQTVGEDSEKKEAEERERKKREDAAADAAARKKKEEEEAERRRLEAEDARKRQEADEAARRNAEEQAARKKREDEELAARLAKQKLEDEAKKPKCGHCGNAINGGYMIFPDRGNAKVHNECQQAFLESQCEKCSHCREILFPVPGKFKGEFMIIGSDKVHVECYDAYRGGSSSSGGGSSSSSGGGGGSSGTCAQCAEAIKGSSMRYENGDRVHNECIDAYIVRTSEKCKHCQGPIAVIPGKYEGTYYIIGSEKVHTECFDDFQKQ